MVHNIDNFLLGIFILFRMFHSISPPPQLLLRQHMNRVCGRQRADTNSGLKTLIFNLYTCFLLLISFIITEKSRCVKAAYKIFLLLFCSIYWLLNILYLYLMALTHLWMITATLSPKSPINMPHIPKWIKTVLTLILHAPGKVSITNPKGADTIIRRNIIQ